MITFKAALPNASFDCSMLWLVFRRCHILIGLINQPASIPEVPDMSTILKVGDVFDDKFEIQAVLGSGGIGTVYKARQLDCDRIVALKILHYHAALDEEYRARFLREAQSLNKLSHANIVTVYHLGLSSDVPYLVMEYLQGKSVESLISTTGRLPVLQSLRIVRDAAKAMEYVHKHDIIHRDLKPANMILTHVPEPDTVKIVDFGLVGLQNQQEQKLTCTGEIVGTATFMSPEQCKGLPVDFRTDIYSLTICLFQMMVGKAPYRGDSSVGLMYKHINEPIPAIVPGEVDRFSPVLNEIMTRGMAKEPQQRFATMDEMAEQIESAMSQIKSENYVHSKIPLSAAGLILAFAVVAAASFMIFRIQQMHRAQLDIMVASRSATTELSEALGELHLSTPSTDDNQAMYKRVAAQKIKFLGPYHHDLITCVNDLGRSFERDGKFVDAEKLYRRSVKICEQMRPGLKQQMALSSALYLLGHSIRQQTRYEDAEPFLRRSLYLKEHLNGANRIDAEQLSAMRHLASCYEQMGRFGDAESLLRRALPVEERLQPSTHDVASCYDELATCCRKREDFKEAERLLKAELSIWEKSVGVDRQCIPGALSRLAACYQEQGKAADAKALFLKALAMNEASHQCTASNLFDLARLYEAQCKYATAEEYYKKAISVVEKRVGRDGLEVSTQLMFLARFYIYRDRFEAAEPIVRRVISIRERIRGEESVEVSDALDYLAECYSAEKQYDKAEELLKRSLAFRRKAPSDDPRLLTCLLDLGQCNMHQGKYGEAESCFRSALAGCKKGSHEKRRKLSIQGLASCLRNQGKDDEATEVVKLL